MDAKTVERRIGAAQDLLRKGTVDLESFSSIRTLLTGINARLDATLAAADKEIKKIRQIQNGEVIDLALESIPDATPEDKKRKKILLFFITCWKDLKSEVSRAEKELRGFKAKTKQGKAEMLGRILVAAKGPFGIITAIAVGVVVLKLTEVSVVIKNVGCEPIRPVAHSGIRIPGLQLPDREIPSGGETTAKFPPLTATVDASTNDAVTVTVYGIPYTARTGLSQTYIFDGRLINGARTVFRLGDAKQHILEIRCR